MSILPKYGTHKRGHDPLTCNKASRIAESCEGCGSAAHTIKRTAWCVICVDEGHETADCESVKILVMQNRQQNSQNREICQICDMQGHSAKTCRKISINQQSKFPSNNYNFSNKSYEHRDKNRNEFLRTNNQNGHQFSNNSNIIEQTLIEYKMRLL